MAENLNYASDNSYCYDDDPANCKKYGRLYTWAAAKKACPGGWVLPNDEDFRTLLRNNDASTLKSTTGWQSGNGTNTSKFNAFPGGDRNSRTTPASYGNLSTAAYFWSSVEEEGSITGPYGLRLGTSDASVEEMATFLQLSVRCIKE